MTAQISGQNRGIAPAPVSFSGRTAGLYPANVGSIPDCRHHFGALVHQLRRLPLKQENLRRHEGALPFDARSFNGRTRVFEARYRGSTPRRAASAPSFNGQDARPSTG